MRFESPLEEGYLVRRYKRFLADVRLLDGRLITAHTANTGSMTGCCNPGSRVWLRRSADPRRKLGYTWEMVETAEGTLVGINTGRANGLVREGIACGVVSELQGYDALRGEVSYGRFGSRIDLLLTGSDRPDCFVEVKSVTARDEAGMAFFPDAVTARGTKHLRELAETAESGCRAVLLFCVQRVDVGAVRPADEVDRLYGRVLREAAERGVEVLAYRARPSIEALSLEASLPVLLC